MNLPKILKSGTKNLDVVFSGIASFGGIFSRVCLGDGSGGFSCSDAQGGGSDVALETIDGDDHLDAVFANYPIDNSDGPNRVCLGDGSGGFGCSDVSADANSTWDVALGDVGSNEIFTDGFESGDTGQRSSTGF